MTPGDSLPTDPDALRALLLAERTHHAEELERLTAIIRELQRHRFGRRAERLDPEQLALALEDAAVDVAAEIRACNAQRSRATTPGNAVLADVPGGDQHPFEPNSFAICSKDIQIPVPAVRLTFSSARPSVQLLDISKHETTFETGSRTDLQRASGPSHHPW